MIATILVASLSAQASQPAAPSQARPPRVIEGRVGPEDYPIVPGAPTGSVRIQVVIGSNGRPQSCSIEQSSGSPALDEASCQVALTRFRFSPARDASGATVVGTLRQGIRWTPPGGALERLVDGAITRFDYPAAANGVSGRTNARVVVGIDGKPQSCTIAESSGSAILDNRTCELIMARFRYKPECADEGYMGGSAPCRPIVSTLEQSVQWRPPT